MSSRRFPSQLMSGVMSGASIFSVVALAVAAGLWWSSAREAASGQKVTPPVGILSEARGDVSISRPGKLIDLSENSREPLVPGDAVMTGAGSAEIEFSDGSRARLETNSRLIVEASSALEITLEFGSMTEFRAGSSPWRIRKNGRPLAWGDPALTKPEVPALLSVDPAAAEAAANAFDEPGLSGSEDSSATTASPRGRALGPRAKKPPVRASADQRSVSDEEIAQSMLEQAGFFKRCALSFFERERRKATTGAAASTGAMSDSNGGFGTSQTVLMSFTLLSSGRATDARATGGDGDDAFKRCLADVVERVPFRRFEGSAIAVAEFPIRIE